jgi:CDP-paratose synthetase
MTILVTGGSGFLGSKLALDLSSMGHEVSLLLRPTSRLDRIGARASEFIIGRAASDDEIQDFVAGVSPDVVVHTACSYGRQGESLLELSDANYRFGLLVLQTVLASEKPVTFINTSTILAPNINHYALTKHHFSQAGKLLATAPGSDLRFINVLLQHMYGPGDDASKFTTHVIRACRSNIVDLDLTAGTQTRDFIYVDDVASAYVKILEKAETFGPSANVEVGSGVAPPVRDFVETAHRLTGSSTRLNFGTLPFRPHEAIHCQADISQLTALGWAPEFDLEAGIRKILETEMW